MRGSASRSSAEMRNAVRGSASRSGQGTFRWSPWRTPTDQGFALDPVQKNIFCR